MALVRWLSFTLIKFCDLNGLYPHEITANLTSYYRDRPHSWGVLCSSSLVLGWSHGATERAAYCLNQHDHHIPVFKGKPSWSNSPIISHHIQTVALDESEIIELVSDAFIYLRNFQNVCHKVVLFRRSRHIRPRLFLCPQGLNFTINASTWNCFKRDLCQRISLLLSHCELWRDTVVKWTRSRSRRMARSWLLPLTTAQCAGRMSKLESLLMLPSSAIAAWCYLFAGYYSIGVQWQNSPSVERRR